MARKAAIIVEEKDSGKWVMVVGPELPVGDQKKIFKAIKQAGGKLEDGTEVREAIMLFTPGKRYKFHNPIKKLIVAIVDDLTGLAESELMAVIKKEALTVKFSVDHDKTRDFIRDARAKLADADGSEEPVDDLDDLTIAKLLSVVDAEELDIPEAAKKRDDILAAVREARVKKAESGPVDDLDDLGIDALLEVIASEELEIDDLPEDEAGLIAAIREARAAKADNDNE